MKDAKFETIKNLKLKVRSRQSDDETTDPSDLALVAAIDGIKAQIDIINSNLDHVDDPMLIESYVYELKALHVKYDYLIIQCKNRGITADFY